MTLCLSLIFGRLGVGRAKRWRQSLKRLHQKSGKARLAKLNTEQYQTVAQNWAFAVFRR